MKINWKYLFGIVLSFLLGVFVTNVSVMPSRMTLDGWMWWMWMVAFALFIVTSDLDHPMIGAFGGVTSFLTLSLMFNKDSNLQAVTSWSVLYMCFFIAINLIIKVTRFFKKNHGQEEQD